MHCIAASPWLRDVLIDRYGASAEAFQLGVDHDIYMPRPVERRRDTVIYYARYATPRRGRADRADGAGRAQAPPARTCGSCCSATGEILDASFDYEHLGVLSPEQLSWLYSEATVGLCLSLTNFSLMPKEMLACGLPCVELAGISAESIFGARRPARAGAAGLEPRSPTRWSGCSRTASEWERRSREGVEFVASHTWDQATDEVEAGLRRALREREEQAGLAPQRGPR